MCFSGKGGLLCVTAIFSDVELTCRSWQEWDDRGEMGWGGEAGAVVDGCCQDTVLVIKLQLEFGGKIHIFIVVSFFSLLLIPEAHDPSSIPISFSSFHHPLTSPFGPLLLLSAVTLSIYGY